MQLLGDRILCKKVNTEVKSTSGLILPTNYNQENDYVVVEIGNKVKHIKPGDKIRKFKNSIGIPIVDKGIDRLILKESDDIEFVMD
ncbi:chaperonin [Myroides sp. LoEW2-1]|uniref:chaperonin n=1 Tax=Myroides sp. LoEW2-1 TaxID=2683192 RepID=UPI00132B7E39|nr:chaperonin [Myroides sp. LoEW2-1]MVX36230.1 chaperonin [Myroides sp. LoEW2-1]